MAILDQTSGDWENLKEFYGKPKLYGKHMWLTQAKQLIRLFNADLKGMVNGLIRINDEYDVDFSFIKQVLSNMSGIQKSDLSLAIT